MISLPRAICRILPAQEQSEGAGARVRRSIGTPHLRHLSPFLMLDHFRLGAGAGFPDHPHRGQETITYMLAGTGIDHEDFAGHRGRIRPGDLQFMTAGRGIVHAEMPACDAPPDGNGKGNGNPNVGLQLWVDLPCALKNCEPRYRDLRADEIPAAEPAPGVRVKVISGRSGGVESVKDLAYTSVWILDVTMDPGSRVEQEVPAGWNAFVYVLEGKVRFEWGGEEEKDREEEKTQQMVDTYHIAVFGPQGDGVRAEVRPDAKEAARFVLIAGTPLDQKIVQYGPFVVNSPEEVYQALMDYQTHSNGFERARDWQSEIGKAMA